MSKEKHVMYHSMPRIISVSLLLAVIAGVGAYLMLPLLSFNELVRANIPGVATGGILALISGVIFLVYLFKSTERFLYEWEDEETFEHGSSLHDGLYEEFQ